MPPYLDGEIKPTYISVDLFSVEKTQEVAFWIHLLNLALRPTHFLPFPRPPLYRFLLPPEPPSSPILLTSLLQMRAIHLPHPFPISSEYSQTHQLHESQTPASYWMAWSRSRHQWTCILLYACDHISRLLPSYWHQTLSRSQSPSLALHSVVKYVCAESVALLWSLWSLPRLF